MPAHSTLSHVAVVVTSFGYGHGTPPTATITLDTRYVLRNPHSDPSLRALTGHDLAVRDHVLATPGARGLVAHAVALAATLACAAATTSGQRVDVAVGCVGGRHRSVALAEEITRQLLLYGIGTEVTHRDIHRPVIQPARP